MATNGVIHFIDGVMLIPKGDLVAVLAGDERFSTLVTAVTEAGLVDTVKNADAFTIFAPTNEAFAKVPADALSSLLADKEALTAVLLRHVVPGAVFSKGLSWGNVSSHSAGNKASAMVVEADLAATNGVVHAID